MTTSDPGGALRFVESEPHCLVRYCFGLRTAEFLLCARCGVYLGAAITTSRGRYGIINVNALRPPLEGLPQPQAVSYESENESQRCARREARWTPIG